MKYRLNKTTEVMIRRDEKCPYCGRGSEREKENHISTEEKNRTMKNLFVYRKRGEHLSWSG